jgi:hypothetical protein
MGVQSPSTLPSLGTYPLQAHNIGFENTVHLRMNPSYLSKAISWCSFLKKSTYRSVVSSCYDLD